LRTPSFAHAQIANDLIRGASAPDSSAIIDSMCLVAGDIGR
jgi:NADH:ubiquinone oxidoreductase subunit D